MRRSSGYRTCLPAWKHRFLSFLFFPMVGVALMLVYRFLYTFIKMCIIPGIGHFVGYIWLTVCLSYSSVTVLRYMTKSTYRRTRLLRAYSFRAWVCDHCGGKHGSKQEGMIVEQWLRAHILIHTHQAERANWNETSNPASKPTFFNKTTSPNSLQTVLPPGVSIQYEPTRAILIQTTTLPMYNLIEVLIF